MRYLEYITENSNGVAWNSQSKIDTGIAVSNNDIYARIIYSEKFGNDSIAHCGRIAGYMPDVDFQDSGTGFYIGGENGGKYVCGRFAENLTIAEQYIPYDITFNVNYVYDNQNNIYLFQDLHSNQRNPMGVNIFVDVNWTNIYRVIIYDRGHMIFDGRPAIDDDGHIGLWDEKSQTLKYNPDLDMYNPEVDCTDCNNWEECGYESYDDCRCQQYGECPEPPEPERTRIVEVISNILSDMVDDDNCELQSWQYNDMATSNVKLDKGKPSPTAVCYQVTDFEYDLRTGIRREKANVLVAFLQKENKLDADGLEQDQIIKQMSDIAFEFLSKIKNEGSLRILNDKIKLKSTFLRSDSNRTGVVIELELEEKSGTCLQ